MGLHRWLGAILVTSVLLVACGKPPQPGGTTTAATTTTSTGSTTAPATTAPPATPTPAATASPSSTPNAATTPGASGTPVAAAGGVEADYVNAEGLMGYEEVQKLAGPASTPDSIAKGKALFSGKGNCVSCHGADGKGDGPAGAALDPPPRNLHAKAEFKYGAGDHGVYRTVYYGVDGTGMAPLEGVLTPEETWDVVHYVHTLQGT